MRYLVFSQNTVGPPVFNKIGRFAAKAAGKLGARLLILSVNIAIFATGANFGAAMPRVPIGIYGFGHIVVPPKTKRPPGYTGKRQF